MPCPCREVSRKEKEVSIDAMERQNDRKECGMANTIRQGGGTQIMSAVEYVSIVGIERRKTVLLFLFLCFISLLLFVLIRKAREQEREEK